MNENIIFLLIGGAIGIVSSLVTAWVQHQLAFSRDQAIWERKKEHENHQNLVQDLVRDVSEFNKRSDIRQLVSNSELVTDLDMGTVIVESGPQIGSEFRLTRYVTLFGSSEKDCHIVLHDPGIAPVNLRMVFAEGCYVLEDVGGSLNVTLNDELLVKPTRLKHEDHVQIGTTTLNFRLDA